MDEIKTIKKAPPCDKSSQDEAKNNPNGSVYEIDWEYPDDQKIPIEAMIGGWKVDSSGILTDQYHLNPNYRPIKKIKKNLPSYMINGARFFKNSWISEIAPEAESSYPDISDEKILGWWYVDHDGKITTLFRDNSKYNK